MKVLALLTFLLCSWHHHPSLALMSHKKISCTAIRDHEDSPTYAFELVQKPDKTYEALYLNLPGDSRAQPEVLAKIDKLKCRFLTKTGYWFQCQKNGASVESLQITEEKLSLIANKIQKDIFKEFRAIGIEVPHQYMIFRFGKADTCFIE